MNDTPITIEEAKTKRCPRPTLVQIAKPNPLSPNGQPKVENAFMFPNCMATLCMKWKDTGDGNGYCAE